MGARTTTWFATEEEALAYWREAEEALRSTNATP